MSNQEGGKAGYKRTEVGVIPEDWEVVSLSSIFDVLDSDRGHNYPSAGEFYDDSHCLFLNASNVSSNGFKFNKCMYINESLDEILGQGKLVRNDIVLTTRGTVGNFAYYDSHVPFEHLRINSGMVLLRQKESSPIDTRYLYTYLRSDITYSNLMRLVYGSAQPQLTVKIISALPLVMPTDQKEQIAIAKALSDTDARITNLNALIHKKEQLKLGTMQQLLTGKVRLKGFGEGAGVKQTELGAIPEDWEVRRIGHFIGDLSAGVSVNSSTDEGFMSPKSVLKTSCIYDGEFYPEESKPIVNADLNRAVLSPKKNTIIISRMNTPNLVGEVGYVSRDYNNLFLPDRLWAAKYKKVETFSQRWLAYVMSFGLTSKLIKESATGTSGSMKNISKGSLLSVPLISPDTKEEQIAIANTITAIDTDIQTLKRRLAKTKALKQGMMQELLTGKTRLVPSAVLTEESSCE